MILKSIKPFLAATAFLLLLPALQAADAPFLLKQDYEKTYTETFQVDGDGEVRLANRYGEIKVETWDRNEVKIDVRVKVSAADQEDADRTFDRIEVNFSGGSNSATAITNIGTSGRNSKGFIESILNGEWPSLGRGSSNSNDFKVYYRVKMPASASLETEAKYCDVSLPDLSGNTNISVGYGNLVAGDLTGRNEVSVSYGSARIDEMGENSTFRVRYCDGNEIRKASELRYDGRYSETRIGTVGRLTIDAGYEELEVESARELRLDGNYNDLEVGTVDRIYLDGNYCDVSIGKVVKEIEVDASYGDLEIDQLKAGFERVYIRVNYIDVEIDVDSDAGYEFELRTRYGDISYDSSRAKNVNSNKSGSSRSATGNMPGIGKGSINISTSYGDIELD
ncbi:DUF4097 family beta strand repeat-containing protein [Neolewinella persica]|uniref:DUF4097 family beta strand repeat-containing protein n=1 Tax=Neolewinella persica TaxID=70998 RepID=UPI0003701F20|nr:DUF4097 family beta strand repeat-containing protein [Neolewinella persica]